MKPDFDLNITTSKFKKDYLRPLQYQPGVSLMKHQKNADKHKYTPVVVLTSSNEEKDMVESYKLGANSYIRKPVDFKQFTTAIKELGLYWLVLNEVPENLD